MISIQLWAEARLNSQPTADDKSLDDYGCGCRLLTLVIAYGT
jgi:hypothetical protein